LIGVITGGVLGIVTALYGFGVWALLIKLLSSRLLTSLSYFVRSKWIPMFHFNLNEIKHFFSFGAHFTGIKILIYWSRRLDDLLIGKFIGTASLGIYSNSYKLLMMPIRNIKQQVVNVGFPVISSIQDSPERIKKIVLKLANGIAILAYPIMIGLFFVADEFVIVLLGEKWAEMIPLVKLFSLASLFDLIVFPEAILAALNKTKMLLKLTLGTRLFFIICIFVGLNWGIYGVAIGVSISMIINFFPFAYFSGKWIELNPFEILKEVIPIFMLCVLMGIILFSFNWAFADKVSLAALLFYKIIIGGFIYLLFLFNTSHELIVPIRTKFLKKISTTIKESRKTKLL